MLLFVAKFLLTVLSYGSGVPGGIFAPLLVLGALVGLMTGQVSGLAFPIMAHTPAAFAVIGMAAAFSAIVRAPLTGIVLILEMTNNYQQLFPLLIACMIAFLVAERLHNKPIYEALLEYDLERTGYSTHPQSYEPVTMELAVEPHSEMDGHLVRDLGLPDGCLMVMINRGGQETVPSGSSRLLAGDHVTVFLAGDAPEACVLVQSQAKSVL
jgi:CIC family chloride channel protein